MDRDSEELIKYSAFSKLQKLKDQPVNPGIHSRCSPRIQQTPLRAKNADENANADSEVPIRQILEVLDLKRQDEANRALNERLNIFQRFSKNQQDQRKESWMRTQQGFIADMAKQETAILQANQQYDVRNSSQHAKLVQQYQDAAQRMKQKQEEVKEKEKQRLILRENIEKIKRNQIQFRAEFEQIAQVLKNCRNVDGLKSIIGADFNLVQSIPAEMETLIANCKTSTVSDKEVMKSAEILNKIINLKGRFDRAVEEINLQEEKRKKEAEEALKTAENVKNRPTEDKVDIPISKINKYVSISNLQLYSDLMEYIKTFTESFQQLERDPSMKQFKFDCKQAINIPVNALSGINSQHILDKYEKLHGLLSGRTVTVSDKKVNASQHPQGISFCKNLLAKKFVLQGDLIVSSNPKSAFCYASMIVSLWNDFPDFGKLLLAYFYKSCPYLVPYYVPRQVDETDEEYYVKLGYQYTDGQVEKQDKFLKRMSGIIKLYSAVLVARPKRGQNSSPHNLKQGWKWLACLLKLEPMSDITATALRVFLETVGFEMDAKYGKIFQKILRIIVQVFLPRCKAAKCTGGADTRLELLLTDYFKNKCFQMPDGYVGHPYW